MFPVSTKIFRGIKYQRSFGFPSYHLDSRSTKVHDMLDSAVDSRVKVEAVLDKQLVGNLEVAHSGIVESARLDQSHAAERGRLRVQARTAGTAECEHMILARKALASVGDGSAGGDVQRISRDGEVRGVAGATPFLAVSAVADSGRDGVAWRRSDILVIYSTWLGSVSRGNTYQSIRRKPCRRDSFQKALLMSCDSENGGCIDEMLFSFRLFEAV